MKKVNLLILLIFILGLLSSCASPSQNTTIKITEKDLTSLPISGKGDSEIIYFNKDKIYYSKDIVNDQTPDLADKILFEYAIKRRQINKVHTLSNISMSSGSKAIHSNNLYIPFSTNKENILLKVNMDNHNAEIIKEWNTFPPLSYVYNLDNYLFLFGPKSNGGQIEYYIDKIDLNNNKEVNIVTKNMNNKKGQLIASIDAEDKYLYAFSINATGDKDLYRIVQYDMNGRECNSYPFDLAAFLSGKKTLYHEDDAISKIYKEKDYFILNTLNGRVFIFKILKDKLEPIKMPEKFYKDNPAGYHFLEYYDNKSNFAYFINTFGINNVIEVFNYLTGEFSSLELPKDNNCSYIYYRNAGGDLIIKKTNDEDINQVYYYYINCPVEIK